MAVASPPCPTCRQPLQWVAQYNQWWCANEKKYVPPAQPAPQAAAPAAAVTGATAMWFLNQYRIRQKVIALAQQYFIEDGQGRPLAYSKQKMLVLKEQIRVFSDESQRQELFRIQQENLMDAWGTFAVTDSTTNIPVGFFKRNYLESGLIRDSWQLMNAHRQVIGEIGESTGGGLMRRLVPGGNLVPQHIYVKLGGATIAEISQEFKIIGDIWNIHGTNLPPNFDRRVLISMALLMGMIERHKK
jgi:uncharacterized protein YxjI